MSKKLFLIMLMSLTLVIGARAEEIQGTIISGDDNEPLIGATVGIKGNPKVMTVTDIDGNYIINAQLGQTLRVSYIGYEPQEVKITSTRMDITMSPTSNMLEEVVAIGYGTMKKSDLTGSVSTVSADKLQKTPSASLANALQGQAAGVTVNSLSGMPGGQAEVRIRGVGTMNNSNPIYVVDGVITEDISFLSPSDIEHTEILKDASATAIYGSRGANGVIIVTTRTGKANNNAKITFDGYVGAQSRWKKLDVMHASEYAQSLIDIWATASERKYYEDKGFAAWLNRYQLSNGRSPYYPTIYDAEKNPTGFDYANQDTDWQDEVFRNALVQNYHLSIDGGGDKFTYSLSGSWFGQEGILKGTSYSRFTARLNTSYQATPWLKIGENISFMASTNKNKGSENDQNVGILMSSLTMAPWDPAYYPTGSTNYLGEDLSGRPAAGSQFKNVYNPFSTIEYSHPHNNTSRWVGNVFAEIQPLKGLTFRSTFNFDYANSTNRLFKDQYVVSAYDQMQKNFISSEMSTVYNWTVDNILTYTNTFGKHDLTAMLGYTIEEYNWHSIGGSGANILNPVETNWYLGQVSEDWSHTGEGISRSRRNSWIGRVNYSFDRRYLATATFRADGSSKFPENTWGYFPSFSLAWRISQENFMENSRDWLNDLKLRFGWGKVGNDKIANNAFVQSMVNGTEVFTDYPFGPNALTGTTVDQTQNTGAYVQTWTNRGGKWESTDQWSLGIDFGLWNNRLTGSIEGFIRNTNDMLMSVTAPAHVGNRFASMANVGQVRNRGIEIQLEHRNHVGDFDYSVSGNVSFIDNKLIALNGGAPVYAGYNQNQMVDEGHSLFYFNVPIYEGIFRSEEEIAQHFPGYAPGESPFSVGDAIYKDVDGDGVFDLQKDREDAGSSIPWLNYGINLGGYWKNFDLQLFFQGVGGSKVYNQLRMKLEGMERTTIFAPEMTDAWTPENPNGSIANPKNSVNYYPSSRFLESGNYFRLKNLQLGYTIPEKALRKARLSHCRLYVQASNLFTVTKYRGYDPELNGNDYGNYPQCRTFIFGVNITY